MYFIMNKPELGKPVLISGGSPVYGSKTAAVEEIQRLLIKYPKHKYFVARVIDVVEAPIPTAKLTPPSSAAKIVSDV